MDFYAAMGSAHALGLRAKNKLVRDFEAAKKGELSGQGLIEYTLIIAIISLIVVLAGPQIADAIREQFNKIADVIKTGTNSFGGSFNKPGTSLGGGAIQ